MKSSNLRLLKCILMTLFFAHITSAKNVGLTDSLQLKSYEYLINHVDGATRNDNVVRYANAWIHKAKKERNNEQLFSAYTAMMHLAPQTVKLSYCDSIIGAAQQTDNSALVGSALISRGIIFYKKRHYKEALNDYLKADALLAKSDDTYLKHKVTFVIAQLKYYLGYYDESRALFSTCSSYFKENDTIPYLRSLHGLAMSLNRLGKYDVAATVNKSGLALAYTANDRAVVPYFLKSDGITAYGHQHYKQAVSHLRMALPALQDVNDYASEGLAWLYLGKSLLALKKTDSAVVCFENIDRIFAKHRFINPPLREAYTLLIAHYDAIGDERKSLKYFRRMELADQIFLKDYKYLYDKITGEYNPGVLKREIAETEAKLKQERIRKWIGYSVLIIVLPVVVWGFTKYKKPKTMPIVETVPVPEVEKQTAARLVNELSEVQINKILKALDKFEKGRGYRQSKISLAVLADKLDSNTRYVAAVILHYKGINHTTYLNDLRIKYVIEMLHSDAHFKKYSIKELAKSAGFATSNHFSNEFRNRAGMLPSDYIKSMSNDNAVASSSLSS